MIFFITFLFINSIANADIPNWAKEKSQEKIGKIFKVVCSGSGPSIEVARKDADESCKSTARLQVLSTSSVVSTVVQTEKEVALHEITKQNLTVKNLICNPENESFEEHYGQFSLWLKCKFDLSIVTVENNPIATESTIEKDKNIQGAGRATQDPSLTQVNLVSNMAEAPVNLSDSKKTIAIGSVPNCDSLLIEGEKPTVIKCKENPQLLIINETDSKITVRAKGFLPKIIELKKGIESNVQVILDPL